MFKRCAVLMVLLLFVLTSAAFAGASGGGGTVFTNTTTTQTVNQGTVIQQNTVNANVNYSQKQGNNNYNGSYTYNSVQFTGNGSNFSDTLTNQFGSPGQSLYWNFPWANPSSGSLDSSQITADNINPLNAGDTANTITSGCATVNSQSSSLASSTTISINLGSTTTTSTTVVFIQIGPFIFETVIDNNTLTTTNLGTATVDIYNALASLLQGNGNNGVGNGVDPQPPGNPPINDAPGTSPGNPGNKNGTPSGNTTVTLDTSGTTTVSPIVLDLSHSGKLDASAGEWLPHQGLKGKRLAFFDLDANGMNLLMEWIGPNAGLLVEPKADGTVNGSCLFGTTGGFNNGYEKLALRDKNGDHLLSGSELAGLDVWIDSNCNGRPDSGELHSLAELKITEIDLRQRNYQSSFVMNGKREAMWDWWPNALAVRKKAIATK